MLRLLDARTGSYAEARPSVPGVLRVRAHVADAAPGINLTGLRVLLTADLLARTAELRGIQAFTMFAGMSQPGGQTLPQEAGALGIHPPTGYAGQWADIDLAAAGTRAGPNQAGILVEVAAARPTATASAAVLADNGHSSVPAGSLGLRLALMHFPYHQPAEVSAGLLASAGQTLSEWRRRVAEWAESPSHPMPIRFSDQIRAALDEADTAALLALLHDLSSDTGVPPGARFEAFAYSDRVLGLDLASEVGRART